MAKIKTDAQAAAKRIDAMLKEAQAKAQEFSLAQVEKMLGAMDKEFVTAARSASPTMSASRVQSETKKRTAALERQVREGMAAKRAEMQAYQKAMMLSREVSDTASEGVAKKGFQSARTDYRKLESKRDAFSLKRDREKWAQEDRVRTHRLVERDKDQTGGALARERARINEALRTAQDKASEYAFHQVETSLEKAEKEFKQALSQADAKSAPRRVVASAKRSTAALDDSVKEGMAAKKAEMKAYKDAFLLARDTGHTAEQAKAGQGFNKASAEYTYLAERKRKSEAAKGQAVEDLEGRKKADAESRKEREKKAKEHQKKEAKEQTEAEREKEERDRQEKVK